MRGNVRSRPGHRYGRETRLAAPSLCSTSISDPPSSLHPQPTWPSSSRNALPPHVRVTERERTVCCSDGVSHKPQTAVSPLTSSLISVTAFLRQDGDTATCPRRDYLFAGAFCDFGSFSAFFRAPLSRQGCVVARRKWRE